MKNKALLCLLLLVSATCSSQTLQDTIALIDKAMNKYLAQNPGCQLSIKRNGQIIFSKAYGMADLEHNVPLNLESKIEAGSVSKQFTAAAILLLEQQRKLSLNDDIRKYIPELPDYGTVIKLEQMMHHTSGLKDWGAVAAVTGWGRTTKNYTNNDVLEIAKAQKTLNNIPGDEFIYSNTGYNLFAIVVERVSAQSLAEFTKQYIFIPAGMTHTEWRDNRNRIVKERAFAYSLTKNGYETMMPGEDAYGAGGLLTTTEDLLKWNDFYLSGKLGTSSLFSKQTQTGVFNNGKMSDYGAGLFIKKFREQNQVSHSGATAGYRANLEVFPDMNLSIALLSNTSQFDTSKIRTENTIRDIFIAENKRSTKEEPTVDVPEAVLNSYSGWYRNERNGEGLKIEVKDKSLSINKTALVPQSENKFKSATAQRWIEINSANGSLNNFSETDTVRYSKVETPVVDNKYLGHYEGKYFSAETNSTVTIFQKDGKLIMHLKPDSEPQLNPTYKDAFSIADMGGNVCFVKSKRSKVRGARINMARARNIEFVKLD